MEIIANDAKLQLFELVNKLNEAHERQVQPRYPLVNVFVLPKETVTASGLVLPEGTLDGKSSNKPMAEGIVLRIWKPWWKECRDSEGRDYEVLMQPTVKVGDHVVFGHWCGAPIPGYDSERYRLVQEGEIVCTLDYEKPVKEHIHDILFSSCSNTAAVEAIYNAFHVIPRNLPSLTRSGV